MDESDKMLINTLQGGFPLTERPFLEVAQRLGLDEQTVIARIEKLLADGVLSRFGPLIQVERLGGAFCLAAMAVPQADFERVAAIVNDFPAVAHNYARDHRLNMWFVLAAETPQDIDATLRAIEARAGIPVLTFPKEREYFVELKLSA